MFTFLSLSLYPALSHFLYHFLILPHSGNLCSYHFCPFLSLSLSFSLYFFLEIALSLSLFFDLSVRTLFLSLTFPFILSQPVLYSMQRLWEITAPNTHPHTRAHLSLLWKKCSSFILPHLYIPSHNGFLFHSKFNQNPFKWKLKIKLALLFELFSVLCY